MRFIGIIPARYASTRFPGKPLAMIAGKPMIERVYEQARKALDEVWVATDDERIMNCVQRFGGKAVMTSPDHPCGTNRCYEAYCRVRKDEGTGGQERGGKSQAVIINIQGDEPFIDPEQIELIKSCFAPSASGHTGDIATIVTPFKPSDGLNALCNPNSPKVVVAPLDGANTKGLYRALYFSRSVIPYLRGVEKEDWLAEAERMEKPFYKHIGMYAYRADVLEKIVALPVSPLEKAESLEQLRWLEAGYEIRVAVTDKQTIGIDTPEDLAKI